MKVINDDYSLTSKDLSTFRGSPRRELWRTLNPLYRLLTPGDNYVIGRFWYTQDVFGEMVKQASAGTSFKEVARSRLAIKQEWNNGLTYMCKIVLTSEAYVWIGKTKYQNLSDDKPNVLLMGNLEQVFVPHLFSNNNTDFSRFAQIRYFGTVQDFY